MIQLPVYMDYHATTPCDPEVLEAMLPWFSRQFGNASSKGHFFGWQAAEAVRIAREELASLLHASPSEIIFTSGATESANLALKGVYEWLSVKGKHIITKAPTGTMLCWTHAGTWRNLVLKSATSRLKQMAW